MRLNEFSSRNRIRIWLTVKLSRFMRKKHRERVLDKLAHEVAGTNWKSLWSRIRP